VAKDANTLGKLWDEGDTKLKTAVADRLAKMVRERQGGSKLLISIVETVKDPGALAAAADAVRGAAEAGWRDAATANRLLKHLRRKLPLETRISIIGALGALDAKNAEGILKRSLSYHNAAVREAARAALENLEVPVPAVVVVDKPPASMGDVDELEKKTMRAKIETERGTIVVDLLGDDAPRTVASFVHLARTNFYKGLVFHRVVPDFVIQGGDPRGDGYGGASYTLRCEYNQRRFGPGAVGMALAGKDTGSSQFFITHSAQPHLDGRYTVFGQVVEGMDVVEAIQKGDVIRNVKIEATK
jgi:cyclophilin family peptidyl-prolyl cis-trans isomerase